MPTREEITYILVDNRMPANKKIAPLSDAAFRLVIESWCWCSAHGRDGEIPLRVWNGMGSKTARKALTDAGLVELGGTDAVIHDYLDIQRSQAEIKAAKAAKSSAALVGNHRRHHVNKGVRDDKCPLCLKGVA